jgi:protein O-mannosyl-transferase
MDIRRTDHYKNKIFVLVGFVAISLIIFGSSTGRIFLSDDYCTLYNIVANNSFLLPSFFRPIGDLTLKWTYQLAGLDPFYFYVANIILHAVNSFLIYWFCRKWFANDRSVHLFSIVAGLIFLTYPSHSEAILWAIGRGVSLATFFSLLAMIIFISRLNAAMKYVLVCLFYFIALACYESALLLPFVLLMLSGRTSNKQNITWLLLLLTTLLVHLYLRYNFTGGIWQAYNGIIFARDVIQYLSAFIKIVLRLFVPPFNHPLLFTICGIAALTTIAIIIFRNRKTLGRDSLFAKTFLVCVTGLFVTILVSISFGMSTRTSEGDRLMYLPSAFYAILMALLIVRVFNSSWSIAIAVAVMLLFHVSFLLVNQQHWNRASEYAVNVINGIKAHNQRPLYIINLPSDHKGAYVFRNCLPQALLFYNIDTTGVRVVNIIQSTEIEQRKELIVPEKRDHEIYIWPNTLMASEEGMVVGINGDSAMRTPIPMQSFLYWNKENLVPLRE